MEYKEKVSSGAYRCLVALFLLCLVHSIQAQKSDKELFVQFENQFSLLDSLIFKQQSFNVVNVPEGLDVDMDEALVIEEKLFGSCFETEDQKEGMKAENGLLVSGQTYYRLDEGFGIDDDDALSRYNAKMQVELRWNFLSSSLINRKSRLKVLDIQGELERVSLEQERFKEWIEKQKEYFREEYDSLLAGVLQLRINNLQLLNDAQLYLVSNRSLSTDELLKIMDEQAIAERQLEAIPRQYPPALQLVRPNGFVIQIDTANVRKHIAENDRMLYATNLQIELLREKEKSTNYWRTLNISPFIRYSFYARPEMRNSSNVDAGIAFQIPLTTQESQKRKALKTEQLQKEMEKEAMAVSIMEKVNMLLLEIERANRGLAGELVRIKKLRAYMELRKANYQGHIGEYNFLSRIKEYNHYLSCWENYYSYQYKRDCSIAELQFYLSGRSVSDFCTMVK